jgi:predicted Zn-dependent protease
LPRARLAQFHYTSEDDKGRAQTALAYAQRLAGDTAGAKVTAEQARDTLEQLCRDQPDDADLTAWLSQAYAVMGEKDLALQLAERAITLLPSTKDALEGLPWRGTCR